VIGSWTFTQILASKMVFSFLSARTGAARGVLQQVSQNARKHQTYQARHATTLSVREALNLAMDEEMERDEDVFVMGEEVAQYQGAYKVTKGRLNEEASYEPAHLGSNAC
jgi:hypothetical protein